MARILLTQAIHPEVQRRLASLGTVVVAPDPRPDTLRQLADGADAIVVRVQLPDDIFEAGTLLAAIRHGAGVDMIPLPQASARGVLVANAPGTNAQSVAEYVFGAMIALARGLRRIEADLRDPAAGWPAARAHADSGRELAGATLGIVGFGHVGRALARIGAAGFGMRVLAANRSPIAPVASDVPVEQVDLDPLLARSDWVVLAVALTGDTRGLIDRRRLAQMKAGACLVNVARGAVLDEAALLEALRDGRLGGAVLDVHAVQPLAPDHPLRALENVVLTPHIAGISEPAMRKMGLAVVDAVAAVLAGRRPASLINPEAWDAFAARWAARH